MAREYKTAPQYISQVEDREVTGIFSVFGNVDTGWDRIHSGAFTRTMREKGTKILHLWQHDTHSPPIAIVKSLREIPRDELPSEVIRDFPDATGGAEVVRQYLDTPRANEVLAAIQAGAPLQMSFGYDASRYDYEKLPGATYDWERLRNLYEVDLWETSDVLWGMNEATTAAKRLPLAEHSETVRAAVHEYIQRQQKLLSLRAKEGRQLSSANRERIAADIEAMTSAKTMMDEAFSGAIDDLRELLEATDPDKSLAQTQRAYQAWQERLAAVRQLGVPLL